MIGGNYVSNYFLITVDILDLQPSGQSENMVKTISSDKGALKQKGKAKYDKLSEDDTTQFFAFTLNMQSSMVYKNNLIAIKFQKYLNINLIGFHRILKMI